MSQQEFQPQEEYSAQIGSEEEIYAQPRPQSQKKKTGAVPKDEHPSTFEESIPPYSYRAQDTVSSQPDPEPEQMSRAGADSESERQRARKGGFSPDGDAFETGYRPYHMWARRPAPSWARPQSRPRHVGRTIFFVILALLLLPVLFKVLLFLLAALAVVFVGVLFFALVVVGVLAILFFALRRSLGLGWPRWTSWRW